MDLMKKYGLDELLVEIKSGEKSDEAFSELVERYMPLINKRVSVYYGGLDTTDRSEAVQEARIALHSAAVTYDPDKCDGVSFGLYASVCISNRLKSLLRRNAKEQDRVEHISEPERIVSGHDLESSVATRDICERVLKTARAVLSEFEYEVFRMSFEAYTTKEIASVLGKTAKSVDNAKYRISKRLSEDRQICSILSAIQ